ncbi:MAG: hypothetical protein RLZ98_126 [Pseudomonadota bacterium]|jgi:fructokinase
MTGIERETGNAGRFRIGIDLGGTKIAATAITSDGSILPEHRRPAPNSDYAATISALAEAAATMARHATPATEITVGIGMPGSLSRKTGLVQNSNSTWLNGRNLAEDARAAIPYPVRFANDANCMALSEAEDGAGAGMGSVFGVILGTGCGGALVLAGQLVEGHRRIAGEWGHNPLPWADSSELPGPRCWCGQSGCIETWISGTGLAADHLRMTGIAMTGEEIVAAAAAGDAGARASRRRHASRLARALAHVVNIFDPQVIVIGGGLSRVADLYVEVPALMAPYVFSRDNEIDIRPAKWGDASGVRGAARLWPG